MPRDSLAPVKGSGADWASAGWNLANISEMADRLRSKMPIGAFDAAWAEGLAMTDEQTAAYAQDFLESLDLSDTKAEYVEGPPAKESQLSS